MEHDLGASLLGLALFLFPGIAWALALARDLGWVKALALSVVLAFTLMPGVLYGLAVLFDVPLRLPTMAFLAVAVGMAGLSVAFAEPLRSRLAA